MVSMKGIVMAWFCVQNINKKIKKMDEYNHFKVFNIPKSVIFCEINSMDNYPKQ